VTRFQTSLNRAYHLEGGEVVVTVSIGVATATPEHSADDLLRDADTAMYSAKRRGKGRAAAFRPEMMLDVCLCADAPASEMGLAPGAPVHAAFKSVALRVF